MIRPPTRPALLPLAAVALSLLVLLRVALHARAADPPADALAMLRQIPPLPKPHISSPNQALFWPKRAAPETVEIVRIMRSAAISANQLYQVYLDEIARVLHEVNQRDPNVNATLTVVYIPYHWLTYPKDTPPTDTTKDAAEVELCRQRFRDIRNWLAAFNATRRANVKVGAVYLNTERFTTKPPGEPEAARWNAAVDAKHDAIYAVSKEVFPGIQVFQYSRGGWEGWGETWKQGVWHLGNYYSTNEKGDGYHVMLFQLPEPEKMRGAFRKTHEFARERGVSEVDAWIALGSGFDHPRHLPFIADWNYDPKFSWQMGAELHDPNYAREPNRYAPYDACKTIVIYPSPLDKETPHWLRHFIAYARGAHGMPLGTLPAGR